MAELARFYGIVVAIYFREHGVPHVHLIKGGKKVVVAISSGRALAGRHPLAPADMRRAIEWVRDHRAELLRAWHRASAGERPERIEPVSPKKTEGDPRPASRSASPRGMPKLVDLEHVDEHRLRLFFRSEGPARIEVKEMSFEFVPNTRRARIVEDGDALDPGDGLEMSAWGLYHRRGRWLWRGTGSPRWR